MQMIQSRSNGSTTPPLKVTIAAAFGAALLLCAGVSTVLARDHRNPGSVASNPGGVKVTPLPTRRGYHDQGTPKTIRCSGTHWSGHSGPHWTAQPAACRDHRSR